MQGCPTNVLTSQLLGLGGATTLVLSGCLAAGLLVASAVVPSRIARARGLPPTVRVWSLDEPWGYTPASAYSILETLGTGGRDLAVLMHITLDSALPLAYAFFLTSLSVTAWGPGRGSQLLVVPLLAALADYSENSAIIVMARRFSSQPRLAPTVAWLSSCTKWILLLLSVALTAYGFVSRR